MRVKRVLVCFCLSYKRTRYSRHAIRRHKVFRFSLFIVIYQHTHLHIYIHTRRYTHWEIVFHSSSTARNLILFVTCWQFTGNICFNEALCIVTWIENCNLRSRQSLTIVLVHNITASKMPYFGVDARCVWRFLLLTFRIFWMHTSPDILRVI